MIGGLPPVELALVLRMAGVLALGTILARPLALRLVPGSNGWVMALLLSWAVIGWLPWMLSALWIVPFGNGSLSGLAVLAAAYFAHGVRHRDSRGGVMLALAAAGLFWLGLAQRMGMPDLTGLEKFTDMAFLTTAMRADWMPPPDPWFGGETVNYYYVGHAMAATWGLIAGAAPHQAYQIAMALLFALTGLAVFQLTYEMTKAFAVHIAAVLSAFAAMLTLYGGNFHSLLYTLFRPLFSPGSAAFYYPDSTRFVGFDPPTQDKAFTEFPAYAFAVGDLHAHVISTPVFLLGLLILLRILQDGFCGTRAPALSALAFGWCMGLLVTINTWDFAALGLVALIAALVLLERPQWPLWHRVDHVAHVLLLTLFTAFLTAAPFLGSFVPFASGIEAAPATTPLWQILTLYGHVLPAIGLLVVLLATRRSGVDLIPAACLMVAGGLLIAIPEVVIMRDIYEAEFARANTMFKFSFRAQTLLIVAACAVIAPCLVRGRRWGLVGFATAVPLVGLLAYLPFIWQPPSVIRSLDGLGFLREERALVAAAATLPLQEGETILEASGEAFGDTARVSALTGQPAVIGWAGHQWLWRDNAEVPLQRKADAASFFAGSTDLKTRCKIVQKYGLRYVIMGKVEERLYHELDPDAIRAMGPAVHASTGGEIILIAPQTCAE